MATRQLDIYAPQSYEDFVNEIVAAHDGAGIWRETMPEDLIHIQVLVSADESGPVLDALEARLSGAEGFRIVIIPVEASIPRAEKAEKKENGIVGAFPRISREELFADISETIELNKVYLLLVVLSTLVAAVGLMQDSVAAIIGAMVIAPLLGPNVGLCLATTLADSKLGFKAAKTLIVGLFFALFLSIAFGFVLPIDPNIGEIAARTKVSYGDIIIALSSGCVGVLAFTTALPTMLVGVMVAVALLPPLVVTGLLIGAGQYDGALGALLLLSTNLICINLAGVLTFYLQGIRPLTWWETEKAKKATKKTLLIWLILFAVLLVLIALSK